MNGAEDSILLFSEAGLHGRAWSSFSQPLELPEHPLIAPRARKSFHHSRSSELPSRPAPRSSQLFEGPPTHSSDENQLPAPPPALLPGAELLLSLTAPGENLSAPLITRTRIGPPTPLHLKALHARARGRPPRAFLRELHSSEALTGSSRARNQSSRPPSSQLSIAPSSPPISPQAPEAFPSRARAQLSRGSELFPLWPGWRRLANAVRLLGSASKKAMAQRQLLLERRYPPSPGTEVSSV